VHNLDVRWQKKEAVREEDQHEAHKAARVSADIITQDSEKYV